MFSLKNLSLGWHVGTVTEYNKEKDELRQKFDTDGPHKHCVTQEFKTNRLNLPQSTKRQLECHGQRKTFPGQWPAGKQNWMWY